MSEAGTGEGGGEGGISLEQLQAQLADVTSQLEKVKSKNDELLTEKKKAQQIARDAEEAARIEQQEKLKAKGDFEQLHKSAMAELEKERELHNKLRSSVANKEVENAALKISADLAEGENVGLLAEFVTKRLKHTEEGIKVTNESGELTVSTLDDLKKTFSEDPKFASLLKGRKSSGGGALGGDKSGSGAPKVSKDKVGGDKNDRKAYFKDKFGLDN